MECQTHGNNLTFGEVISRQAHNAQREMVRTGQLLVQSEFLALLGVGETQIARMVAAGSVFSMKVDGVRYFPAVLGDPAYDRKRLHAVCRILVPAPPECRLHYLRSKHCNLGGVSPLDALHDDQLYRVTRRMARAWAAEWFRTVVKIYIGSHIEEPAGVEPVYTAADELDPRINVWKRAMGAMRHGGYIAPSGPYPRADEATVFILQSPAGNHPVVLEARLVLNISGKRVHVALSAPGVPPDELLVPLSKTDNVVDVLLQCIDGVRRAA